MQLYRSLSHVRNSDLKRDGSDGENDARLADLFRDTVGVCCWFFVELTVSSMGVSSAAIGADTFVGGADRFAGNSTHLDRLHHGQGLPVVSGVPRQLALPAQAVAILSRRPVVELIRGEQSRRLWNASRNKTLTLCRTREFVG